MKKYLYVFTRKNLDASQVAVQSIHAAYEMGRHSCPVSQHPSVILIKTKDESELFQVEQFLKDINLNYRSFVEPYYDNSLTSIAVPVSEGQRILFKKFKLFRNKDFQGENK